MTTLTTQFLAAVRHISEKAHVKFPPELHGVIERGTALVLNDMVRRDEQGAYTVLSSNKETWYSVNGYCSCDASKYATDPEDKCKHRWAVRIYKRAQELCEPAVTQEEMPMDSPDAQPLIPASLAALPDAHVIPYATLLTMAHASGLMQLEEEWLTREPTEVTAKAIAVFADGRRFSGRGHASLENTPKAFHAFLPAVALTRAKSRALKDALAIGDQYTPEELNGGA
jgi:hypothetical protein